METPLGEAFMINPAHCCNLSKSLTSLSLICFSLDCLATSHAAALVYSLSDNLNDSSSSLSNKFSCFNFLREREMKVTRFQTYVASFLLEDLTCFSVFINGTNN
jgi:hypothetical protein